MLGYIVHTDFLHCMTVNGLNVLDSKGQRNHFAIVLISQQVLFRCYFLKLIEKVKSFSEVCSFQTTNVRRTVSLSIFILCLAPALSASVSAAEEVSSAAG